MDVTGKTKLFVTTKESKGNNFNTFRASISSKKEDGHYESYSLDVEFDKTNFPNEKLAKFKDGFAYTLVIEKGWLGCRSYQRDGKRIPVLYIHVEKAHCEGEPLAVATKQDVDDSSLPF